MENYKAGKITQQYSKWESITSDPTILDIVNPMNTVEQLMKQRS